VLIGLIVLLKAFAYYLDRYGLAFSDRGYVQGPHYTDVNAVLPAKNDPHRHRDHLRAAVLREHRGPEHHPARPGRSGCSSSARS
jgi:hypothetical protein